MRKRGVVVFTSVGVLLVSSVLAATSTGGVPGTVTYDQTFSTPGEASVLLPDGVRAIDVDAIGGNGGSISNIQGATANGGRGARVTGRISVTPASVIWVEVGGNGAAGDLNSPGLGGFNGGGDARIGSAFPAFYNPGAGGGGASDVRTQPRSAGLSPDPRLIVAAGGGGGGKPENGTTTAGGGHGGAGFSSGAAGAAGTDGIGGADAGAGGSSSAGGAGGSTGPSGGSSGTSGSLGEGGDGGANPNNTPSGGGGGGGGLYGGGGGRSGGNPSGGGGGGGGGSSLIPAGGTVQVAPPGSQPRVRLSYTIPDTVIASGPAEATNDTTPDFSFEASEGGSSFECRIDSTDDADFAPCPASFTAPVQDEGEHTLDVRAVNAMGNFDATPASSTFTVDTTPPVTTITGPATTTDTTPTFTYSAEPDSTFECAFDSAAVAPCPDSEVTSPPLAVGAHVLTVEATDAAGNVEVTPATKEFTVEAAPPAGEQPPRCGGEVANLVGTDGNDRLRGTSGPDTIVGLDGKDRISGRGGKDMICGGNGKDRLSGGAGVDRLNGDAGKDALNGGNGRDRCVGGKGRDSDRNCEKGRV